MAAVAAYPGSRLTPNASVSEAMPESTRVTKSLADISASRVMSHAAPQHSARASESSMVSMLVTSVSSERSSSRILA